jgi:hypothetical protein
MLSTPAHSTRTLRLLRYTPQLPSGVFLYARLPTPSPKRFALKVCGFQVSNKHGSENIQTCCLAPTCSCTKSPLSQTYCAAAAADKDWGRDGEQGPHEERRREENLANLKHRRRLETRLLRLTAKLQRAGR